YHVRFKTIPQPFQSDVLEEALPCAAISGDMQLARRLARAYKMPPRDYGSNALYAVLRHLLADDDNAALAVVQRLESSKAGYAADWPPELAEFPIGVARNDPKLLIQGLKKLNTRFKGRWDEKTWRARYDKITSGKRPRWRGTWDQMHKDAR